MVTKPRSAMSRRPQLPLFGESELPRAPGVRIDEGHAALAASLPTSLWMGTMSWNFPGWKDVFFSPQLRVKDFAREGLEAYAEQPLLRAVELDRTYYQPIPASLFEEHAKQVPADFRFLVKAHEDCTVSRFPNHARYGERRGLPNPRRWDVAYAVDEVITPFATGLGAKAGPLLFQFSPEDLGATSVGAWVTALHRFLSRLPKGPRYAVEVRNPELLTADYAQALADSQVSHCYTVWGAMPSLRWQARRIPLPARGDASSRPPVVLRWVSRFGETHEEGWARFQPFDRLVSEDLPVRDDVSRLCARAVSNGSEVFAFVSNRAEGHAPESVFRLGASIRSVLEGLENVPENGSPGEFPRGTESQ